jgi:hypothetical protein
MDNPEWVSRVTPPTTTMQNTSAQHTSSHDATWLRARAPIAGWARVAGIVIV